MLGPTELDVLRRICLVSDAAWLMDELVHGDPVARVMVIGRAIAQVSRTNPDVLRLIEVTNLMASLEGEARARLRAKSEGVPQGSPMPRETMYPGARGSAAGGPTQGQR
ncbi:MULTISPECIES: hypothetical protein [unclassified Burkholderia]|uniref:hypothetical protein n=1 Tax=unclassified Burkholderia TaxID=2613784 RepID=UPI002AB048AD|nr:MULTISPECIES: hypothetical protein [unclassified Burkholderia]